MGFRVGAHHRLRFCFRFRLSHSTTCAHRYEDADADADGGADEGTDDEGDDGELELDLTCIDDEKKWC
jgi:hypothetical protein